MLDLDHKDYREMEVTGGGGERKRVVVIGGGVAGSLLAKSLQFNADFTLIDQYASFSLPTWNALFFNNYITVSVCILSQFGNWLLIQVDARYACDNLVNNLPDMEYYVFSCHLICIFRKAIHKFLRIRQNPSVNTWLLESHMYHLLKPVRPLSWIIWIWWFPNSFLLRPTLIRSFDGHWPTDSHWWSLIWICTVFWL